MSTLRRHLEDYVVLRRSLGFVMKEGNFLLPSFVDFLDDRSVRHVTIGLCLAWANAPRDTLAITRHQRLGIARGFASYLHNIDDSNEVPPADLLPASYSRVTPYLFAEEEIDALMVATRSLVPTLRAKTYATLIGLLSVSGLRVGEAIRLERDDIDYGRSVLVVHDSKHERAREVPLHETTLVALNTYERLRDHQICEPRAMNFFLSPQGKGLNACTVNGTYRGLIDAVGLKHKGARCRPRLHDLRHSFAVRTLIDWYRDGVDVDASMPLLSKVLGHASPKSTYWYLEAAPELLALIAARVEPVFLEFT